MQQTDKKNAKSSAMRRTDKTLLEQMQLSDLEIDRRKALLGLTADALSQLSLFRGEIAAQIDVMVEEFYEIQTSIDEISLLIGDADTLARLRKAQRQYILDLFSGQFDSEYVNHRLRIGMVHNRIGVKPKLYLSGVVTMKEILMRHLQQIVEDPEKFIQCATTLDKLFYFDTTLVFDTYIDSLVSEVETEKRRTEEYAESLEDKVLERTQQLERLTKIDPLTNVYNRRALQEIMRRELAVARRREWALSFIYFDVDKFKTINDSYGHAKGDEVLQYIGDTLQNTVREADAPCRYGGDEFCVLLPECNKEDAVIVCEKIAARFTRRYPNFSLSFGVATTGPTEFMEGEFLVRDADTKMYQAKKEEGTKIVC